MVGQTVLFTGTIQGGRVYNLTNCQASGTVQGVNPNPCTNGIPGNWLFTPGYHIYWFFGEVNNTGNDSNTTAVQQHIPVPAGLPPSGCTAPSGLNTYTPPICNVQSSFSQRFAFNRTGTFDVSITVYDSAFDWVVATTLITVVAPQFSVKITSATAAYSPNGTTTPIEGLPTSFAAICLPLWACLNVSFFWNFGDGGTGSGLNPSHTYQVGGDFVATLTGTDVSSGAMNRSFAVLNVTNLSPFGSGLPFVTSSLGPTAGSLQGPLPAAWYYGHSGFRTIEQTGGPILTVTAGSSVNFCTLAFDTSPIDAQNLTFRWHFSNTSNPYSYPVLLANAPVDATQTCEPNGYIGYPYSFQSPLRPAVLTTITHSFLCPGFYNVTVSAWDPEGLHNSTPSSAFHYGVWIRGSVEVHAVNLTGLPQSQIPAYSTPIGQVAYPNAQDVFGNAPNAFWNYTWNAGTLGTTWGDVGRDTSYKATTQRVGVTAQANSTALPCCNPHAVNSQTWTNFTNVAPTVGIDSFYTEASITVTIENPSEYNYLNITLLENNRNEGWYNMSYYVDYNTVTLQPIDFQLSDQWKLLLNYTPYGHSGGTYVDVQWSWSNDDTSVDNYDATESDMASDTTSVWFSNSNTTKQNEVPVSVNTAAVGEPFTAYVVFFSPGQTNLTENWTLGDGTVFHEHDSAPRTAGPTMSTWLLNYAYNSGANYNFNVTVCDDHHWCRGDKITVYNTNRFWVNDTAPFISLNNSAAYSTSTVPGVSTAFQTTVYNQDNTTGGAVVTWQFGDQQASTTTTSNADGSILYGTHVYRYSFNQYLVVVYADSKNGSASANYTFVSVGDVSPTATYTVSPAPGTVGQPVNFNGEASQSSGGSAVGLAFGWLFGDGNSAGGEGTAAEMVSNVYANTGTYTSTLTVETDAGRYAYARQSVTINAAMISQPYPYVTNQTNVTADVSSWFTLHVPSASILAGAALLNATWYWADGSYPTYGRSVVHTFLEPGNYNVSARVTAPNFGAYWAHALVHVQDGVPTVSIEFGNGEIYGETHPTNFTAIVLGDYADQYKVWHFTWAWGDGSSWANTTGTLTYTTVHTYTLAGTLTLTVNVSGPYRNIIYPWSKLGAPNATVANTISSVPDIDGDGIPDALAASVTQTSITSVAPSAPAGQEWGSSFAGYGCTNYVGPNCQIIPGIGSFSGDNDGDGLTNIQEIMGTVTGFYSDPLQFSTSGDGVADGAHSFTSQYTAPSEAYFTGLNTTTQTIAAELVPGVAYGGPSIAFNRTVLTVQLSTSSLSSVVLYVSAPGAGWVSLGTPSSATSTYNLVQSNPVTGQSSPYGISVSNFAPGGNWLVGVVNACGCASGTIVSATFAVSYYTNPTFADPSRQGMITGQDLSVPVFNCSESRTISYPVFNPATYTVTNVNYYPWTLSYYKLSVLQGIPYVPLTSTANWQWDNNATSSCGGAGVPVADMPAQAFYLGDASFGIAPWNAHAAGDAGLTNGMKALGASTYHQTANKYLNTNGVLTSSTFTGYPSDPLYGSSNSDATGPLNPTSLSTAGVGVPDSQAIDPIKAIGLEVTITQATDPYCYLGSENLPLVGWTYTPSDIAELTFQIPSGQNEPTIYTPVSFTSNGNSGGCASGGGSNNFVFNYGSSYFFPIPDQAGSFTFNFALWQNQTLTAQPSRLSGSSTINILQSCNVGCATASLPSGFSGSISVVTLSRAPVVLVNQSGEVGFVPGYGYRYGGEQTFDSFSLNLGTNAPSPFSYNSGASSGLNVVLESRDDVQNSPFYNLVSASNGNSGSQDLANLDSALGSNCQAFNSLSVTSRSSAVASESSVDMSWSADVSTAPTSCVTNFLDQLLPNNGPSGTQVGGWRLQYTVLSSYQLELLGLSSNSTQLDPFVVPASYSSPSGTPPTNLVQQFTTAIVNGLTAIAGAIVAFGNFLNNLPALMQQLGQSILGAISSFMGAVSQAVQALAAAIGTLLSEALSWLINEISQVFKPLISLLSYVLSSVKQGITSWVSSFIVGYTANGGLYAARWGPGGLNSTLASFTGDISTIVNDMAVVLKDANAVLQYASGLEQDIANAIVALLQDLLSGLGNLFGGVLKSAVGLVSSILSAASGFSIMGLVTSAAADMFDAINSPDSVYTSAVNAEYDSPPPIVAPVFNDWGNTAAELSILASILGFIGFSGQKSLAKLDTVFGLLFSVIGFVIGVMAGDFLAADPIPGGTGDSGPGGCEPGGSLAAAAQLDFAYASMGLMVGTLGAFIGAEGIALGGPGPGLYIGLAGEGLGGFGMVLNEYEMAAVFNACAW